ncbi:MmcQ/YjbR family DNA-binding protein [Panacibacter ginsenosidivorans]|uniref:MmcQ/YjbR family DNA-binding protein n=1 Tax=Panacibacter ginsenosidivorans TaxID=1813871 RepID=A0A5B8VAH6_9BACT|nr:MmcQ/YjbR family DNA-binding protein [Panacibacter ginsenosidivorans]QEC68500.1 MmcQ/YjbR family DNA-binding protein [Panacibacter ginsenosidivorans]
MVTAENAKAIALSLPETGEQRHFNRTAFTVKKKIFATLSFEDKTLNLKFTPEAQFIFCPPGSDIIFAIPNGWGRQGWTTINLDKASKKLVMDALKEAYRIRVAK